MNQSPKKLYLYLGIGLPSGFLLIFLILSVIGNFMTPPQNDVIFTQKNYGLNVTIINNKLIIDKEKGAHVNKLPNIVRFNPITKKTTKYKVVANKQNNNVSYSAPDFPQNIKINHNKTSKDGYSFVCNRNDYLFFAFNKLNGCLLHKWGKNIVVKDSDPHNSTFLGWVENE